MSSAIPAGPVTGARIVYLGPRRVHLGVSDLMPRERALVTALRHALMAARVDGQGGDGVALALAAHDLDALAPAVLWLAIALDHAQGRRRQGGLVRTPKSPMLGPGELSLLNALAAAQAGQVDLTAAVLHQVAGRHDRRLAAALHGLARQLRRAGCLVQASPLHPHGSGNSDGPWHDVPAPRVGHRE